MKAYVLNCPHCGVALRGYGITVGIRLGCPNIASGQCGRPSRARPGHMVPKEMIVTRVGD